MSTVLDWSGNSRNGTGVVVTTYKPRYRTSGGPNSLPSIQLYADGSENGGYFSMPNFISAYTAGHCWTVFKKDTDPTGDSDGPPLGNWGTTNDSYFPYPGDNTIYEAFGSNARKDNITHTVALNIWGVYEIRTASAAWSNYINGTQQFTTGTNTVAFSTAPTVGQEKAGRVFRGQFAETFFYNRVLTSGEITTIKSYITAKYGITMA